VNLVAYTIDFWTNVFSGKPEEWGAYPSLYNNFMAEWIYDNKDGAELWGPFIYYDLFTLEGWWAHWWMIWRLDWFFIYELIDALIRDINKDWNKDTYLFNLDRNNMFPWNTMEERFDKTLWENYQFGMDCNGNLGKGLYCYCPS
jgi:hypothetical protein